MEVCDERRILKSKKKQQPNLDYDYSEINSSIRKKMNKAQNDWIESQCKSIDYDMYHGRYNIRA